MAQKTAWAGWIVSVQPRIRLTRSFDERSHTYLGYALGVDGRIGAEERDFGVGVGKTAHEKHGFQVGQQATGLAEPVANPKLEPVDFYKASAIRVEGGQTPAELPPWHGVPPPLDIYRTRGHRRLSARTYEAHCSSCIWGSRMPVEMILDHWNPERRQYRFETFCYGPKSCRFYQPGPTRKVPGRKGMSWEEEDWVDAEATAHRAADD